MNKIIEKIQMFIAWHLPHRVVMWCFIRVMALAWAKLGVTPDEVTYSEAYKIIEKEWNIK